MGCLREARGKTLLGIFIIAQDAAKGNARLRFSVDAAGRAGGVLPGIFPEIHTVGIFIYLFIL